MDNFQKARRVIGSTKVHLTDFQMALWFCQAVRAKPSSRVTKEQNTENSLEEVTPTVWSHHDIQLSLNGRGRLLFASSLTVYHTILQLCHKRAFYKQYSLYKIQRRFWSNNDRNKNMYS